MGERLVNGFFLLCSLIYLASASQLTFGTSSYPRSGFVPIIVGVIATVFSIILFINSMKKKDNSEEAVLVVDFKKLFKIIGVLLTYVLLIKYLGYVVSTCVALFIILKIAEVRGKIIPLIIATSSGVGLFLLFDVALKIPLP